ncbi:hypothetical protein CAJAP_04716 [Camponotus japonicus]
MFFPTRPDSYAECGLAEPSVPTRAASTARSATQAELPDPRRKQHATRGGGNGHVTEALS